MKYQVTFYRVGPAANSAAPVFVCAVFLPLMSDQFGFLLVEIIFLVRVVLAARADGVSAFLVSFHVTRPRA